MFPYILKNIEPQQIDIPNAYILFGTLKCLFLCLGCAILGRWKDGSTNRNMYCSSTGPKLSSQHPCWGAHTCQWLLMPLALQALTLICAHIHSTHRPNMHAHTKLMRLKKTFVISEIILQLFKLMKNYMSKNTLGLKIWPCFLHIFWGLPDTKTWRVLNSCLVLSVCLIAL